MAVVWFERKTSSAMKNQNSVKSDLFITYGMGVQDNNSS
jgi:hypothetical protein